jgi:hypothetical protein
MGIKMRSYKIFPIVAIGLAIGVSGCASVAAEHQAEVQQHEQTATRMDVAHIWVTSDLTPPPGKPYTVLGDLKYTEAFSPDAIDEDHIKDKLKKMALAKWPDSVDAIVKENQTSSPDGSVVTVTAEAIQYKSSVDRAAMHQMTEGIVASPTDQ